MNANRVAAKHLLRSYKETSTLWKCCSRDLILPQAKKMTLQKKAFQMQRLFNTSLKSTTSIFLPIQDIDGEIRNVHYFDSWAIANNNSDINHVDPPNSSSYPPLIILGGTGQTVDTYAPHIRALSKERRLLIIELRCQGRTELLSEYGTVQQQVSDIKQILDKLKIEKCDLLGFSFGGRVGLAVASKMNGVVNKLTVTGVPLRRPALGQIILKSWHDSLKLNEMRSCAWSFLINGYSEKFLNKFATKLSLFVDVIIKSNDPKRLFHLLEHSHVVDDSHPFSVPNCCATITCLTQVVASRSDRIAGHSQVKDLADALIKSIFVDMDGGHLAPFEEPVEWRRLVLDFLNSP